MSRQNSALASLAKALRSSRGMSQLELAAASGVHVSTIKNLEADRHIAPETAVSVFEQGFAKSTQPLREQERLQIIAYWLQRSFPNIQLPALESTVRRAESAASAADKAVRAAISGLDPADASLILTLTQRLGKKDGARLRAVLRALVEL